MGPLKLWLLSIAALLTLHRKYLKSYYYLFNLMKCGQKITCYICYYIP